MAFSDASKVEWYPAKENDEGIKTIAVTAIDSHGKYHRIVGYNGILKDDKVLYEGKEYTVVMVSRLGHMGLSETGVLPYTLSVYPNELKKLEESE